MTEEGERIARIERDLKHLTDDFVKVTDRMWKLGWFIFMGLLAPWVKYFMSIGTFL